MASRAVTLICIVLIVAIATSWLLDDTGAEPEEDLKRNDPDLYMLNATIRQFTDAGEIQHTLSAERFTHFPLTDVTTLQQPNIALFTDDDVPWAITAKHGRLLSKSTFREEVVELWDDVVAIKHSADGRFINIQTQSLIVYPEREYAETDQKVRIDNNTTRTTAPAMKAHFRMLRFTFLSSQSERVKTVYVPQ